MSCDAMSCDDDHDHEKEKVEVEEKTNNSHIDNVDDHKSSGLPFSDLTLQMDFGRKRLFLDRQAKKLHPDRNPGSHGQATQVGLCLVEFSIVLMLGTLSSALRFSLVS